MSGSRERREEFASYLRSRRARLRPGDVGLPVGTRRRVLGLRREEVAQLAGVGLTWYTWLEQGRPIAASEQVLAAIARALLLTDDERDHLFALAGLAIPEREGMSCVHAAHLDLLEKVMPYPAAVQTARFDVLAYNRVYRFLFQDLDEIAPEDRNCARLIFTDLHWQQAHADLDNAQRRIVARVRAAYGRHRDEPGWQRFVTDLRSTSPAFAELWERGDVATERSALKRLRHHLLGELNLEMTSMWLDEMMGARLVWFAPADAATASRLEQLERMTRDVAPFTAVG
ncbi:transcriptional regulator with XRE-family HTH domain [Microbacterium resistens]|uniref:Transcriptional regulator with XRE-family HTH domain n=1 Tax=Microbacterium resistens TaxID=156977 RepID=A0ABU1SHI5_9MICO|nr:helix-turn-helix transcriptional regulator [Microbacterium resistens]MDR6868327.1 transcriptional regulator with XRE-family HTH domain [Microbacterium resistens]